MIRFHTLSFLFFIITSAFSQNQNENYQKLIGKDYERAISYLKNGKWIDSVIILNGLKPSEVKAIVFPEIIRYNSIQNKIETFALETLYAQYGKSYANFSIGPFQIKPSFAEKIEIDFLNQGGKLLSGFMIAYSDTIQSEANRSKRVKWLKNKISMLNYICAFFKLMNSKYPTWKSEEEKIKFFATAYNCGYWKNKEEITIYSKKKFFQTGFGSGNKYSYSDISLHYYRSQNY